MILKDDQRLYHELFEAPLKDAPGKKKYNIVKLPPLGGTKLSSYADDQLYRLLFGSEPPQIQPRALPPPPAYEQHSIAAGGPEGKAQPAQGNGAATPASGPTPRRVPRPKANGQVPQSNGAFTQDGHFMQQQQEEEEDDFDISFDELDVAAQHIPAAAPRISEPQHPPTGTAPPAGAAPQRPPPGATPGVQPPRPPAGHPPPSGTKNSSTGGAPPATRPGSSVAVPGLGVAASGIAGLGMFKPTSTDTLKPGQPGAAPPPAPPGQRGGGGGGGAAGGPPVAAGYGRSQYINVNTGLPTFVGLESQAVFPSQDTGEGPLKLPKQTRVTPEEYKEFLTLGHGEIFTVDLDRVIDAPWRLPNANMGDFFNYGLNERTWRDYCLKVQKYRQEYTLKNQITTFDDGGKPAAPPGRGNAPANNYPGDGGSISADIAAVINRAAAASAAAATATAIPVFTDPEEEGPGGRPGSGTQEDFRAKTTEWRRHKARLDPEAVIELSAPEEPLKRNNFPNAEYEQPAELMERDRDRFLTREDVEVMREARQRPQAPLPPAPYVPSIAELYEYFAHLKPKPPSLPPPPGLQPLPRPPSRGPAAEEGAADAGINAADNQPAGFRPPQGPRPPPGSPPKGEAAGNAGDMPALSMPGFQMPSIMGLVNSTNANTSIDNNSLGMQMPPLMGMGMNMMPNGMGMAMMPSITPGNAGMGMTMPGMMMMGQHGQVLSPRQGSHADDGIKHEDGQHEQLHAVQSHGFMDDIALEGVHDTNNTNDNYFFAGDTNVGDYQHHDDVDRRDGDGHGFYGEDAEGGGDGWSGPDTHPSAVFDLLGAGFGGQDDYQPEQDYDNPDDNMGASGRRPSGSMPTFRGRPPPYDRGPASDRFRPRSPSRRSRSPPRGGRSPPRGGRSPPRGGRSPARSPVRSRGDRDRSDRDKVREKDRDKDDKKDRDREKDKERKPREKEKESRVSKEKDKSTRRSKSPVKRASSPARKGKHRSRSRSKERHKPDEKKKESRSKR